VLESYLGVVSCLKLHRNRVNRRLEVRLLSVNHHANARITSEFSELRGKLESLVELVEISWWDGLPSKCLDHLGVFPQALLQRDNE
jgi:hypothetical protein